MLKDDLLNVFIFQQHLLFAYHSNHRYNSGTQTVMPFKSYIFLCSSPQAVEWQLERHHFCDASCSLTSSTDELFLEQNTSATICS